MGAILKKMVIFKEENALRPVENQGDDATENDNFQTGKQRLQGRKNLNFIFV